MEPQLNQEFRYTQWFQFLGDLGTRMGPPAEAAMTLREYCERYPVETWVPYPSAPHATSRQGS